MAEVRDVLECWTDSVPCPRCGISNWIVDGDAPGGRFWLLCVGCVETRDIPEGLVIAGSLSGIDLDE